MSDEFDWQKGKDAVVVPRQEAVAVYINDAKDIVIRREKEWPIEQDDVFIVIPRVSARRFIEALERVLREGTTPS